MGVCWVLTEPLRGGRRAELSVAALRCDLDEQYTAVGAWR